MGGIICPDDSVFLKFAVGELVRSDHVFRTLRRGNYPYVLRMFEVQIARTVQAINRTGNHAYVALVLRFRLRRWFGGSRASFCRALFCGFVFRFALLLALFRLG